MIKKLSLPFIAFLQATGVVCYLVVLSCFFNFVNPNLPYSTAQFYVPIIMLLIFMISAVVCASLFLGRAGYLFWEKKYKEAFTLIAWTVFWGLIYLSIFLFILITKK